MFQINHIQNQIILTDSITESYAKINLNLGGSLQELTLSNKKIIKNLKTLSYNNSFSSAILFPFTNRIENGKYSFNNNEYNSIRIGYDYLYKVDNTYTSYLGVGIGQAKLNSKLFGQTNLSEYTMQTGMMIGAIVGATNGFFMGSMVGMIVGTIIGVITGKCCGVMGLMEGAMAGLMGGTMGPMITVMMFSDHVLIFMPLYMIINIGIMLGLSYMLYEEIVEGRQVVKKPLDFNTLAAASVLALIIIGALMIYGPSSALIAL